MQDEENSTDDEGDQELVSNIDGLTEVSRKRRQCTSTLLLNKRPRTVTEAVSVLCKALSEQQEQHMRLLREQLDRQHEETERTFQTFLSLLTQQQVIHVEQPSDTVCDVADTVETPDDVIDTVCVVTDVHCVAD